MPFFEDPEVVDLAELNQGKILRLEDREAERILKTYRNVRQDLRDRLDVVGRGSFSEQQLRGALIQVDGAIRAMSDRLMSGMSDAAETTSQEGVEALVRELERWDKHFLGAVTPINIDAAAVATDTRNFLVNRYQASMDAYSSGLRSKLTQTMSEAALAGQNYSDIVSNVGRVFLGEEWKLNQLVRTELHNIYNLGKIRGMGNLWDEGQGSIPDLRKTLYHRIDARTGEDSKRLAQNNPIVKIDEPFIETSTGKRLEYMAPPNRPNDRAILIPYREAWGEIRRSGPPPEREGAE
jgi:hypothetical protein